MREVGPEGLSLWKGFSVPPFPLLFLVSGTRIPSGPPQIPFTCKQSRNRNLFQLCESGLQFLWLESERSWTTLIAHSSIGADEIDAIGPAGIGLLSTIAEIVHQRREFYSQLSHAHSSERFALVVARGTGKDDLVAHIALHLPHVAGMRFEDVNGVEVHVRAVIGIQLIEGRNLPPEWRSGVAAEDQHYRLFFSESGEIQMRALVQTRQGEIRRNIANVHVAGAGARPHRFKRSNEEDRHRHL